MYRPIDFHLRKYSVATVKMVVQNWFGLLQEIQAVENALRKNTLGEHGVSTVTDQYVLHARFVAYLTFLRADCTNSTTVKYSPTA